MRPGVVVAGVVAGVVAVVVVAWSMPVHAAAAPHLQWRSIATPCCDVHFPADLTPLGQEVAGLVDECVTNAGALLNAAPRERIQLVLSDVNDSPNGFASVVPYDRVELRAITPEDNSELAKTSQWLRLLVQHEIMHVVHLDVVHGLPSVVNVVLGKSWPPNLIQPRAFVEGLATYAETRFSTAGGRLRSSLFKAPLLIAALEGDRWSLDDVANASRRPPGAAAAYVYGSFFIEFMTRKYGDDLWAAWAWDYGGQAIPYGVQRSMENITGRELALDWQEFLDEVKVEAETLRARVAARGGPTQKRRLTRLGGLLRSPTFSGLTGPTNDDTLLFSSAPPNGPAGIYALRGLPAAAPQLVPLLRTNDVADLAVVDDLIVFAQTATLSAWSSFSDLFVRFPDGRVRQLTQQQRIRNPDRVPGTRRVVAEQRTGSISAIVFVDVDSGAMTPLVTADAGNIFYTPHSSADGRTVLISRLSPSGQRSIAAIDVATHAISTLIDGGAGGADLLDPRYTPDGQQVVFVDDRDGVFAVYAYGLKTHETRRIVDTLGGASQPVVTPDGKGIVFADTHLDGVDLYVAAYDFEAAAIVSTLAPLPLHRAAPLPPTSTVTPYHPWPLLLPRAWLPTLSSDPVRGAALGFVTDGADPANLLWWQLRAAFDTAVLRPSLSFNTRFANFYLPLSLGVEVRPNFSDRQRQNNGIPELQRETLVRANASLSIPLRRLRHAHHFSFGVQRQVAFDETGLTSAPDSLAPRYPTNVLLPQTQTFTLDWFYSSSEQYRDSVSAERNLTSFIRLRLGDRRAFSDVDVREIFCDVRAFQPIPGLGNHALAVYLSGGSAFDQRPGALFVVGGFVGRDLVSDVLTGSRSGPGVLRGFSAAHLFGDTLVAATLEYRFPVLEIERGIETLPLFLDRLHAAVFVDTAMAFTNDAATARVATGVGVELRLQVVLGYYGYYEVRAGFARGLSSGGVDQPYAVLGFPY